MILLDRKVRGKRFWIEVEHEVIWKEPLVLYPDVVYHINRSITDGFTFKKLLTKALKKDKLLREGKFKPWMEDEYKDVDAKEVDTWG